MSSSLISPNTSTIWASNADEGVRLPQDKLEKAAKQFEALVLSQLLKSARESSPGGLTGDGTDQASSTMSGLAEEHFAQALAAQGGLGLARMISQGLIAAEHSGKGNR